MKSALRSIAAIALSGCASAAVQPTEPGVRVTADDPVNPRQVRFDVPSAYVLGLPGDRVPITLQARIATREIAAPHLSELGYCRHGFTGPDEVFTTDPDRLRAAFVVDCNR